jgi:hypothetical protein
LTQSQANELEQRVREGREPLSARGGFGHGRLHVGVGRAGVAGAASRYLGIAPETLRRDRQSGKSLAQIAESTPGKSVAGLKAAILAQAKERLDTAVSRGRISAKQEGELLPRLASRIDALLKRSSPGPDGPAPRLGLLPPDAPHGPARVAPGGPPLY